jgi:hypothetical protein
MKCFNCEKNQAVGDTELCAKCIDEIEIERAEKEVAEAK